MAGGDLLLLSHGYLGAVVRRPAQRGDQGLSSTARLSSFDIAAESYAGS